MRLCTAAVAALGLLVTCPSGGCIDEKFPATAGGTGGSGAGTAASSSTSVASGGSGSGGAPCLALCRGACVDLFTDPADCGGCGIQCADGVTCDEGICGRALPRGAGSDSVALVKRDGSLWTLGGNVRYVEGSSDPSAFDVPTLAPDFSEPVRYAAASLYTLCVLLRSGAVDCVGTNATGELGTGRTDCDAGSCVSRTIQRVLRDDVVELAGAGWWSGGRQFCARKSDGSVWCWGEVDASCSDDSRYAYVPTRVPGISDARAVTVGAGFACAIRGDGTVWCWGQSCSGEFDVGTIGGPTPVPGLSRVTAIAAGVHHACAVAEGEVRCWGDNGWQELGTGSGLELGSEPMAILETPGLDDVVQLAAGYNDTCALTASGQVFCWGDNTSGAVGNGVRYGGSSCNRSDVGDGGDGSGACVGVPTRARLDDPAVEISIGYAVVYARLKGGGIDSWGGSAFGALGHGVRVENTGIPAPIADFSE